MDKGPIRDEKPTISIETSDLKPKLGIKSDLFSPSDTAPEVILTSPSSHAPQLVDSYPFKHSYVHHGEDKILSDRQYAEGKILSSAPNITNGVQAVHTGGLEVVNTSRNQHSRRISKRQSVAASLLITLVLVVVAVGTWIGVRKHGKEPSNRQLAQFDSNATGMAALYWMTPTGDKHYGVYYQNTSGTIMELAYDSVNATWKSDEVTNLTHQTRPGTSLAAAAGWPHANYSYTLVSSCIPD
jgi:hypothetical protein